MCVVSPQVPRSDRVYVAVYACACAWLCARVTWPMIMACNRSTSSNSFTTIETTSSPMDTMDPSVWNLCALQTSTACFVPCAVYGIFDLAGRNDLNASAPLLKPVAALPPTHGPTPVLPTGLQEQHIVCYDNNLDASQFKVRSHLPSAAPDCIRVSTSQQEALPRISSTRPQQRVCTQLPDCNTCTLFHLCAAHYLPQPVRSSPAAHRPRNRTTLMASCGMPLTPLPKHAQKQVAAS